MRRRARTARAVENDERILDAATSLIVERGVDTFGLRDVAVASGLTYGALYGRYENVAELFVDLWVRRLGAEIERLVKVSASATASGVLDVEDRRWVTDPTVDLRAAIELCIVAARVEELGDILPRQVHTWFEHTSAVQGRALDPMIMGVASLLFGAVIVAPVHGPGHMVPGAVAWIRAGAGTRPMMGPPPAPSASRPYDFETHDEVLEALLQGAVDVVARSGLQRATLKRIGRVAGYSPSVPYAFYETRDEMMFDVVSRCVQHTRGPSHPVYVGTPALSAAAIMAGAAAPDARRFRRLSLEFLLGAFHDDRLAGIIDDTDRMSLAAAAATIASDPSDQHAVIGVLEASRDVALGLSLLTDLVDGEVVDWRPFTSAFVDGLTAPAR